MADNIYDPEDKEKDLDDLSPEDLKELEDKYSTEDDENEDSIRSKGLFGALGQRLADREGRGGMGKKLRDKGEDAEVDEDEAINLRLKDFYSDEGGKSKVKGRLFSKGSRSRKLGFAGAAVGIPSLLAGIAFLPGLLGLFKMQNFFENINTPTFLRLNAAFDNRSDKWLKAYIKLRLTEIDGDVSPGQDTLYFRANKVDTNNPIRDWYRTMRTSKFEKDLFEREGISFKSGMKKDANGRVSFGLAIVTIRGTPTNYSFGDITTSFDLADTQASTSVLNKIGPDLDRFVEIELLDGPGSNKNSRRAIKDAVNRNTNSWRVFQRRHLRKSIANMTGVKSWRLFETKRDKLDERKKVLFDKIMVAVLPENRIGKFVACLFGAGNCPSTTDPSSKESNNSGTLNDPSNIGEDDLPTDAEEVGNPGNETAPNSSQQASDLKNAAKPGGKLGKQIRDYIGKFLGNPYTKVWTYLKKLAHIHDVLSNNVLGKMVVQGRRAQYMAAYATMAIAISQMKSGDISDTQSLGTEAEQATGFSGFAETVTDTVSLSRNNEVNEYMNYFNDAERSEAWILYGGGNKNSSSTASAASEDQGRAAYCDMTEVNQKLQPVYYRCNDESIGGKSRADSISEDYNSGIGKLLGPIATAVEEVRDSPLGWAADFVEGVAHGLVDKVVGPVLEWVLETTGGKAAIEDIVTTGVVKAMEYVGAGVKYDPTFAGQMNFMMMGASATSEASARNNGAALTSSLVGLKDYSNKMALDWKKEKEESMSSFERYASLSNPRSFASTSLVALSTSTPSTLLNSVNPTQGLDNYASALNGRSTAANEADSHSVAEWSGVDTYDFPQQCIDLDQLEPDYFEKATNAPAGVARNMATLGDADAFWTAVYDNFPGTLTEKETQAASVYNCILLDRSVMGGLGYAYGYTDDGGYADSEDSSDSLIPDDAPPLRKGVDIPGQHTGHMECPISPTSRKLHDEPEAYKSGVKYTIQLCSIHGLQLNAIVAETYDRMFTDMKNAGYTISGSSSFRTMASQEQGWNDGAGSGTFAKPGFSNHQFGIAVDIKCQSISGVGASYSRNDIPRDGRAVFLSRVVGFPCLNWLHLNSYKYNLLISCDAEGKDGKEIRESNGGCEPWHISPTGG